MHLLALRSWHCLRVSAAIVIEYHASQAPQSPASAGLAAQAAAPRRHAVYTQTSMELSGRSVGERVFVSSTRASWQTVVQLKQAFF